MKIVNRHNIIAGIPVALTLLTSCERTELCYDHYPKSALNFRWEREWERDYGEGHSSDWKADFYGFDYDMLRPGVPEWVKLVKYVDNHPDGEHYLSPLSAEVVVMPGGDHSFLFYNGDTEYIVLSDIASMSEARASASPRSRSSISYILEKHPNTRTSNPPDALFSAFVKSVPEIGYHQTLPMNIKMQPLVYTYVVRYEFEYGLQHVLQARGALAGMAESVYLRDGRTSDESVIVLYDCEVKNFGCEAWVRSFGVPGFPDEYYGRAYEDTPDRPYTLNLELLLTNGTTLEFNFDVADQLRHQPRGGVITVKGIRVEDHQNEPTHSPSSGFDVDLSGWGEVDVDLPITS